MGVRRQREVGVEADDGHRELHPPDGLVPCVGVGGSAAWTAARRTTSGWACPLRWWVQGTMLVASLWLALVVAMPGPAAWACTAVALALLAALLVATAAPG